MREAQSVVVVGAGVAGLVAARTLARRGVQVTVVDPAPEPGGCVARHTVAGIPLDSGAESFATRGGTVTAYLRGLDLGDVVVTPNPKGAWVQLDGDAAPLPRNTVLGIPGVPLAADVVRIVGWAGAIRAQLDRYIPLVRVKKSKSLGDLVRRRMGQKVLDRLVAPIVSGVHSAHPDLVDVEAVSPGLLAAVSVQGSLSAAVLSLIARRGAAAPAGGVGRGDARAGQAAAIRSGADGEAADGQAAEGGRPDVSAGGPRAGSAVGGIDGGMFRLVEALVADCERYGVDLHLGVGVQSIRHVDMPHPTGAADPAEGRAAASVAEWMTVLDDGTVLGSHGVVVAAGFRAALELLQEVDGLGETTSGAQWPGSSSVTLATLVLDAPALDSAPRGTGVLVAEDVTTVGAKALTHATAKWDWLAEAAGPGRHVLRLSYGRGEGSPAAAPATPAVTEAQALADASTLLGVPLDASQVRGFALVEWRDSLAFATGGHRARVDRLVEAVHDHPGLEVVGAWISGTGLAYVIDGAQVKASELAVRLHTS